MVIDSYSLAERISSEIGFEFTASEGWDREGQRWFELYPTGYPIGQTFTIRTIIGWRRIDVIFRPAIFAGELVEAMRTSDEGGRQTFRAILDTCQNADTEISFIINETVCNPNDDAVWDLPWRSVGLEISKGMLSINKGNIESDMYHIELWTSRMAAAIISLLPLEETVDDFLEVFGLPEGAKMSIEVNRYERDRRNRAAALAIHGYTCSGCDLNMEEKYGNIAAGIIEVHHVKPISELGADYIIDPINDLIPLCPNCHAVVHKCSPPLSIIALRKNLNIN
ncbi:HNH endonuclease [Limnobaculum zhutongyuii]|uniref:HNH endonuclease n=1 Tax=Limnobaculum zhutongyuii TaxID=2498113 RepID=A0A411WLZ6_9GAMM|nr:HNH endonuclease [Limnobaculum zhutongyuii]QBH97259.1 HNH endonuclease [Limnobaculum zhutongyuii]TQS88518.1 HNH endonuclease [Limnobaculum zhutongyuii]